MQHLAILPILLPAFFAVALLLFPLQSAVKLRRVASVGAMALNLLVATLLLWQQTNVPATHYLLGNWPEPFGILLVADQLSALFVWLTTLLTVAVSVYSCAGDDEKGSYFHPLLHFLLMGLNGAFLTGDLFNLFVFFEVLLISSYGLLVHGGGKKRIHSALHYVVLNLVGSALFLLALALLYAMLGSLHMADMAERITTLAPTEVLGVKAAAGLLLIVFGLKAALLPLHFWLPAAYSQASASVAAVFAVMTKVGIYSLLRVFGLLFGASAGTLSGYGDALLWWGGLLTMLLAAAMVLAAMDLKKLSAALVLLSAGTLLAALGSGDSQVKAAALLYAIHSSWIGAVWYLLSDMIARQRGSVGDRLVPGPRLPHAVLLGWFFVFSALVVIGMPPFSGFVAKLWLIQGLTATEDGMVLIATLLLSSLAVLVALSRAGSVLFWRAQPAVPATAASERLPVVALGFLLLAGFTLVIFGQWWTQFCADAIAQLLAATGDFR
jgi:multicomponent K+:H+ antiporter subunit D